jgi:hypothetical protein
MAILAKKNPSGANKRHVARAHRCSAAIVSRSEAEGHHGIQIFLSVFLPRSKAYGNAEA